MQKPQELITSRQNPLVMLTAKLAERKYREAQGLFRFDGKKLFLEALLHPKSFFWRRSCIICLLWQCCCARVR